MYKALKAINSKYQIKRRALDQIVSSFCVLTGLSSMVRWGALVAHKMSALTIKVRVGERKLSFIVSNPLLLYRAQSLFTKEPETIDWLYRIPKDGVLFDIGANVGMYSVLGGAIGLRVISFEPVSDNYAILNNNIRLNGLSDKVSAYCLALSDGTRFGVMNLSDNTPGSALHSFGEAKGFNHQPFVPTFKQGSFSISLDSLIYEWNFNCPTHLKIDVDGLESKIIDGAEKLITDKRLVSILIELNSRLGVDQNTHLKLVRAGFKLRQEGLKSVNGNAVCGNYIFVRETL